MEKLAVLPGPQPVPAEDGQTLLPVCMSLCGQVGEGRACLLNWGLEWEGHLSAGPIGTLHSNK